MRIKDFSFFSLLPKAPCEKLVDFSVKGLWKHPAKQEAMRAKALTIDISSLSRDCRGMGFFVRQFLDHLAGTDHPFIIHLAGAKSVKKNHWPYPALDPRDLDRFEPVWFPFNFPSFKPPGKYVVTVHDLAPFDFPAGESKLRKRLRKGVDRAERVITDSRFIARELQEKLGAPESKISVIPPGFSADWPLEEAFHPPAPFLLSVGPAEPRKNHPALLEAFRILKKRKFPHKLAIVGELPPWRKNFGPLVFETANPLPKIARKMGLESEILFPGFVSRAELKRWYERASAAVVASLYEGFGFPVLEAFSCGTPAAVSSAAGLPETGGEAAFYFDPRDPADMAGVIESLLTNPAGVEKKREAAKLQLSRFDWEPCVQKHLEVFETLY